MAASAGAADDRVAWANRMRLLLSPKGAVNADGSIKQARLVAMHTVALLRSPDGACALLLQEFFKPKQVVYVAEKKWGETERDKLYEARPARAGAGRTKAPTRRRALAPPFPAADCSPPARGSRSSALAHGVRFVRSCCRTCAA